MRVPLIVVLLLFVQAQGSPLDRPDRKENQMEVEQKRGARVHRVAESESAGTDSEKAGEQATERTSGNEKLGSVDVDGSMQREAELLKELEVILKELSPEGTNARKNVDLAINEMQDGTTSATLIKPTPRSDSVLGNLLNSPEVLDIYYPDGQDERRAKTKPSPAVESMLKTRTIAQYLDKILMEVQSHITYIRNIFEKLCRKHRSKLTQPEVDGPEKLASTNQPKKIPIF